LRCSTLWNEADKAAGSSSSSMKDIFSSTEKGGGMDDATHGKRDSQAKKNNAKAQKGGKVLLAKLMKNPTIQVTIAN